MLAGLFAGKSNRRTAAPTMAGVVLKWSDHHDTLWELACQRRRPDRHHLFGKQLPNILERLELQRIPARIEQKHRRLFAHQPLKTNPRLNHEASSL